MCAHSPLQPYIAVISALGPSEGKDSDLFHMRAVFTQVVPMKLM